MTKNRTPTPVYLDPGMHSGLEVKGLRHTKEKYKMKKKGKAYKYIAEELILKFCKDNVET